MTRLECDLVVLGSGFGGTLLAIIAQKLGYSTILLERGSHPRFAIGESSTPLSNFKLARIAERFGLDWLKPFARYGTWNAEYPHLACGLKRGFSFFRHEAGRPFQTAADNSNALLVAASPDDSVSDTHWYRAEFDANLVERAVALGIPYRDRFETTALRHVGQSWEIAGKHPEGEARIRTRFVVDASGTGQALARALNIPTTHPDSILVRSRGLFSHFTGVGLWQDLLEEVQPGSTKQHPYPCDAAALHQVIDSGWMWILRFENGITSAGFSLDPEEHPLYPEETAEQEWRRLVGTYPSLERQFRSARPVLPFVRTGRLQRRLARAAGPDWAMLPHTAGFLDAWLSPGIAQSLFAVNRLAGILADGWGDAYREERLEEYGRTVIRELAWVDEITGTCFACFDRFPIMAAATMIYFTAATYCEERERNGEAGPDDAFLLADHAEFRSIADRLFTAAQTLPCSEAEWFLEEARRELAPFNRCGLCDPARRNMYPFIPAKR